MALARVVTEGDPDPLAPLRWLEGSALYPYRVDEMVRRCGPDPSTWPRAMTLEPDYEVARRSLYDQQRVMRAMTDVFAAQFELDFAGSTASIRELAATARDLPRSEQAELLAEGLLAVVAWVGVVHQWSGSGKVSTSLVLAALVAVLATAHVLAALRSAVNLRSGRW
jgi:hypothetical protein